MKEILISWQVEKVPLVMTKLCRGKGIVEGVLITELGLVCNIL
jgi:hypothetical protein